MPLLEPHRAKSGADGSPVVVVPHRGEGAGAADLPAEYQRLMQLVAEEGPVRQGVACSRVTANTKLGLTAEPRHTEGVRVKLKQPTPGRFTVRP